MLAAAIQTFQWSRLLGPTCEGGRIKNPRVENYSKFIPNLTQSHECRFASRGERIRAIGEAWDSLPSRSKPPFSCYLLLSQSAQTKVCFERCANPLQDDSADSLPSRSKPQVLESESRAYRDQHIADSLPSRSKPPFSQTNPRA